MKQLFIPQFASIFLLMISQTSAAKLFAAPADVAKPSVDMTIYGHVVRVGWVVKDLDRVVNYWETLGLRNIQFMGITDVPDVTYRGKKTPLRLKMAFANIGGVEIEWNQPVKGFSVYDEFLKKHGDGIHRLAYAVKSPQQLEEQIEYFKSRGVGVIQRGSWEGKKGQGLFAYLDTASEGGGLTIDLNYNPDLPPPGSPANSANEYPFNKLVQYAFVVRDVKKVGAYYERLGFGGMPVDHNISVDRIYRGKPGKFEMYLGWGRFGDVVFEWIQSLAGGSVYDEYLKAHGEGLHHLAFNVKDMDEAIKLLDSRGAPVSQSGGWKNPDSEGRFAYMDSEPYGGVTIELLWNKR
jgi:catechol 2,3-dioxygenase-like lactoylglutathione lyase family enzyme